MPFRRSELPPNIASYSHKQPQYQPVEVCPWSIWQCWILFGYLPIWSKSWPSLRNIQHCAFQQQPYSQFEAHYSPLISKIVSKLQCCCQETQFEPPISYWWTVLAQVLYFWWEMRRWTNPEYRISCQEHSEARMTSSSVLGQCRIFQGSLIRARSRDLFRFSAEGVQVLAPLLNFCPFGRISNWCPGQDSRAPFFPNFSRTAEISKTWQRSNIAGTFWVTN